jgi:hypothetical protein
VEHSLLVGLVHLLQASEFRHGFAFVHFSAKRNSRHHHHGRISSILSVCPIVCCSDVDCYVSGTFNDYLGAFFGWFGRRQMAKIQFHDFSPRFFVLLHVFAAISLIRRVHRPQNASDPSFYPYILFLVLFLAVCRRMAVILVRKVRPDGSSTVGNSCCGVKAYDAFTDPQNAPDPTFYPY